MAKRGKRISDEVRAAVMAALMTGQGVSEVAEEYKLSRRSVGRMKAALGDELPDVAQQKKDDLSELILDLVRTNIKTLTLQSVAFRDPAFIRANSAAELATLHGVIADKTIRILAALETAE